jgi:hypothetical protein
METDINFDIYLYQILNPDESSDENILEKIANAKNKYNSEDQLMGIYNITTSYINGDFNDDHPQRFVRELNDISINDNINDFIFNWGNHISQTKTQPEIYDILNKLLSNTDNKSFKLTNLIWSIPNFRNQIKIFPYHKTAKNMVNKGIFKTLFSSKISNYKTEKSLNSVSNLINDVEIYPELIKYIHNIIRLNEPYCAVDYMIHIENKKCSKLDFNIFILKLIYKMYINYFDSDEKKDLLKKHIEIVEFKIEDLELPQQIYVTMLYGFHVLLNSILKIYCTNRKHQNILCIKIIKQILNEKLTQNLIMEYINLHEYVNIEIIFEDILYYFDVISAYNDKDKLNVELNNEMYKIVSNILGGYNNKIKNVHIRKTAFIIINTTASKIGFLIYDNFFNNLFKYINDINLSQLGIYLPVEQVSYQNTITMILKQMVDVSHKIEDESKYIFAETLYRLISNNFNLFDMFNDELNNTIKDAITKKYFNSCFNTMIETSIYTLLLYKDIYDRQMIDLVCKETESKYINFIGRIIKNIKMSEKNLFRLNGAIINDNNLITLCYNIINSKVDENLELVAEIKDDILNTIDIINIDEITNEMKENIKNKLDLYKDDIIEYPDELLDKITCCLIKNPVMIPNNNEIFEKSSIVTIIYEKLPNPYTRELLTLEILENYNKEEHVIKQITKFNDFKEKWFNENIKN